MASEPLPLITYLRPKLDPDALLGLPGEIAVRLAEATGADEAAILLSTLAMLGSAAGPEPHIVFGGAEHPARLFAVIVGKVATGRKGTATGATQRLFEAADPRWAKRIDPGLKSPEAMLDRVDDNGSDTRLMIIESEFSRLVETMAQTRQFSERLREAWDGTPMANTTKKNPSRATHAHISLVGSITPEKLEHHHKRLSQGGGLESRLLYCISAPDINDDANPFAGGLADFPDLVDRLRLTLDVSRSAVLDRTDPLSRAIFLERGTGWQPSTVLHVHDTVQGGWRALVRDRLPRADNDGIANLWARGEVQVVRLAAAYAIGTASDTVTAEHVDAAVACWKYCAESAEALFGIAAGPEDGAGDRAARRKALDYLLRCAGEAGGWVTQTQLNKVAFAGNAPRGGVARVLKYLVDKGFVEYRATPTRGRPKHEYRLPPREASGLTEKVSTEGGTTDGYRQRGPPARGAHPRRTGRSPGPREGPGGRAREGARAVTVEGAPSALALRVWDLDRQHLALKSFNARPRQPPPWWIDTAFSEPTGGWPKDRPLVAECKGSREHTAHLPECRDDCEEHDGGIPAPNCRCGIYCTRSPGVVSDYLLAADEPVVGLVEMGGRFILAEPDSDGYARGQYARVVAVLLIDKSLTIDHPTLRNLAAAYRVPALEPHSTDPDEYRDRITVTSTIADEAEEWLRRLQEGGA